MPVGRIVQEGEMLIHHFPIAQALEQAALEEDLGRAFSRQAGLCIS